MIRQAFHLFYKGVRKALIICGKPISKIRCTLKFYGNLVEHKNFETAGVPYLMVARGGKFTIGKNFRMNNTIDSNPIGFVQPCIFFVDKGAKLVIGDNVNLSQTSLICHTGITVGDHVKMGGGVCVYDTDFHSLDGKTRRDPKADLGDKKKQPVVIGNNVFIGAKSTILKGVTIGDNSIVGASSLVTKDIPANEIWGGNPAKKIKSLK